MRYCVSGISSTTGKRSSIWFNAIDGSQAEQLAQEMAARAGVAVDEIRPEDGFDRLMGWLRKWTLCRECNGLLIRLWAIDRRCRGCRDREIREKRKAAEKRRAAETSRPAERQYRVHGANRDTGLEVSMTVKAADEDAAERVAISHGLLVESVFEAEPVSADLARIAANVRRMPATPAGCVVLGGRVVSVASVRAVEDIESGFCFFRWYGWRIHRYHMSALDFKFDTPEEAASFRAHLMRAIPGVQFIHAENQVFWWISF